MEILKKVRTYWRKIRKNWKIKYRLIIRNESAEHDSFSLLLSPRNIFVVVTTSAVLLILLTAMLIAFTPLRVYVPGYTSPDEYRKYRAAARRVDSVELILAQNQQYIDNFYRILNDQVMPNEMPKSDGVETPSSANYLDSSRMHSEAEMTLRSEADDLLRTIAMRDEKSESGVEQRANIRTLFLRPPTQGTIIGYYNLAQRQYGIDIANKAGTLITSAGDGIVIFSGYDVRDGNVIIIQHSANIISVYKHNRTLLKAKGTSVKAGEPIAEMGRSGQGTKMASLHFELWYDGTVVDPLNYLTLK